MSRLVRVAWGSAAIVCLWAGTVTAQYYSVAQFGPPSSPEAQYAAYQQEMAFRQQEAMYAMRAGYLQPTPAQGAPAAPVPASYGPAPMYAEGCGGQCGNGCNCGCSDGGACDGGGHRCGWLGGDCACVDDDCDWAAGAGWLYLKRGKEESRTLIQENLGGTLLNANSFNFDFNTGADAWVLYKCSCDWSFQGRYVYVDPYDAQLAFTTPAANGAVIFPTNPATLGNALNSVSVSTRYLSALQTAELGLRRNYERLGILYGFRFVDLDERFQASYVASDGIQYDDTWTTHNRLYGFQLGADSAIFKTERFKIEGFGKAGVYANVAESTFLDRTNGGSPVSSSDTTTHVAFLGEVGLYGVYFLNDHIALRGGYQVMWLSGVAVASEQVASTGQFTPVPVGGVTSAINSTGDLLFHGVNAGVEITW